jgi:hypothetical protein
VRYWQQEEQRIGCAIDLRVMAVAALRIPELKEQVITILQRIGGTNSKVDETQIFNLLQSLLWLNCHDSCPDCIQTSQPYQEFVRPSRSLLLKLLQPLREPIQYNSSQWKENLLQELQTNYRTRIACEQSYLEDCKQELLTLLTEPIEIGYQFYYPMIERLALTEKQWIIHLHIREFLYA